MPLITSFLGSSVGKYAMIGLAFIAIIGYYNIQIWSLESTIDSKNNQIGKLEVSIEKLNFNLNEIASINKSNNDVIDEFQDDVKVLRENNELLLSSKFTEITRLKKIIQNFQKPVVYVDEVKIKDCTIKIKEDSNESDIVFSSINNIGF